ncbi:helix-turn-helix transcriptional regulator [Streptomyces sp. W1SF4]|uniref:helix-turn-helix transcriptional regulator n=1 Tax=Streptomyces sp. W1SF4 TaxID=2305220 RepID=UPI000F6FD99F|nr:helix-turn-helix transcriptional regulator [Streptomyces sp. W1SF4]AZM93843.1 XRE family transcriptional regulator [Streptomyces sp. W1SF4]
MNDNHLGDFLRARRAAVRPGDVGMASHGTRRVAGLRREEVAVLAGVNADYYTRLEQGRERHPSAQVVDALSRALLLDADAAAHLHRLAGTVPARPHCAEGQADPALRELIDGYTDTPAVVTGPALDILAANALAEALYSPFRPADNLATMVFLDPAGRHFHAQWDHTAKAVVGHLREAEGLHPGHPRLRALVHALLARSADFARLWSTHTVRGKTRAAKHFRHPDVGALHLTYHAFDVRHAPGQQLIVYHAEPDSPSAQALRLLGSVHATAIPAPDRH